MVSFLHHCPLQSSTAGPGGARLLAPQAHTCRYRPGLPPAWAQSAPAAPPLGPSLWSGAPGPASELPPFPPVPSGWARAPSPQGEAGLLSSMRRLCGHPARAGPVPGGGRAKSPEQRTYRDLSRRQRGSVCLSHQGEDSQAPAGPSARSLPLQPALGRTLHPFMNSQLLEGRQLLGSVSGKRSGRASSPWAGATLEWKPKPQESEPGAGGGAGARGGGGRGGTGCQAGRTPTQPSHS